MNISGLSGINFKATLLAEPKILKYNQNGYKDYSASFVEMNPKDTNDLTSVSSAVSDWKMDLYGMSISKSMEMFRWSTDKNLSDKFFAITTQKDNYSKIKPENIKALAHVYETNKRVRVVHLQVDPDLVYGLGNPDYRHVGKGMIDCLKDKYNDRSITLISSSTATKFYEKQGFERTLDPENRLTWNKQAEDGSEYKDEYW